MDRIKNYLTKSILKVKLDIQKDDIKNTFNITQFIYINILNMINVGFNKTRRNMKTVKSRII